MTFKVRPYLREHYPCRKEAGGCGADIGEHCIANGRLTSHVHAPRWGAWRASRSPVPESDAENRQPGEVGLLAFLRDSYECDKGDGGCGAPAGWDCRTFTGGEVTRPHAARWNALDRQVTANRPDLSVNRARDGTLLSLRAVSRYLSQAQELVVNVLQDLQ